MATTYASVSPERDDGIAPDTTENGMQKEHNGNVDHLEGIRRYATAGSVMIPMDALEKLYLNPPTKVKGDLRQTFGNPTPMALMGFLIASTPLGCQLMGWRGSGGAGASIVGTIYFFGGTLQILGAVMEWVLGNTFSMVVFATYGAFWLTLATTLVPFYNAEGYFTAGKTGAALVAGEAEFYESFGFYLLFVGVVTFIYFICSFRTNLIFVLIFLTLDIALFLLVGFYWKLAVGDIAAANSLQYAAGALTFTFCAFGWYLLIAILLQTLEFPFSLPVFDLSQKFPSKANWRRKSEAEMV